MPADRIPVPRSWLAGRRSNGRFPRVLRRAGFPRPPFHTSSIAKFRPLFPIVGYARFLPLSTHVMECLTVLGQTLGQTAKFRQTAPEIRVSPGKRLTTPWYAFTGVERASNQQGPVVRAGFPGGGAARPVIVAYHSGRRATRDDCGTGPLHGRHYRRHPGGDGGGSGTCHPTCAGRTNRVEPAHVCRPRAHLSTLSRPAAGAPG